jgi:hypothetical protein
MEEMEPDRIYACTDGMAGGRLSQLTWMLRWQGAEHLAAASGRRFGTDRRRKSKAVHTWQLFEMAKGSSRILPRVDDDSPNRYSVDWRNIEDSGRAKEEIHEEATRVQHYQEHQKNQKRGDA